MFKKKRLIWIISSLLLGAALFFGLKKAGILGKEEGEIATVEKALIRNITEVVNASGKIYPEVEVKISPDISGEVVALYVQEGDTVKKGQVLAKIYADIYATQRDQVKAGLAQAEAQMNNANASIIGLKAILDQSKKNLDRQQKLMKEKIIAPAEFESANQQYLNALSNYNAAKESLKGSEASISGSKAQLQKAEKDLDRTILTAPMDGVISLMAIKKGERVAGNSFNVGTEMMRIADLGSIEARVDVGENDITKVSLGDTALVELDAYSGRKFKGIVYKIANPVVSSNSLTGTTEAVQYKVHVRIIPTSYSDLIIPNKRFPFRPNMSASVDIQTKTKKGILTVPINSVTTRNIKKEKNNKEKLDSSDGEDDYKEVVFVAKTTVLGTIVNQVVVKTGIQDLNHIEINEGLSQKDSVVTAPYALISKTLKDGQKIKIVSKEKLYEKDKKAE